MKRGELAVDHAGRPADYPAWARQVKAAGFALDVRYLCRVTGHDAARNRLNASKIARRPELDAARAAGLAVAFVWQDTKHDAQGGYDAGLANGIEARRQADALGYPAGAVIFAAVDYDTVGGLDGHVTGPLDLDVVASYLTGFRLGLAGRFTVGVYGEHDVIEAMLAGGHAELGWQTRAWSGGRTSSRASMWQGGQRDVAGVTVDVNNVLRDDLAVWAPSSAPAGPGPTVGPMIRSRAAWGAKAPLRRDSNGHVTYMTLPAKGLWLHHTVTPVTADPNADFRRVEAVGVQRFGYLSYSYLSHPADVLGEGAGTSIGAHTEGRNSTTFGLAFIGNYDGVDLNDAQVEHVRWLYWHLRGQGLLVPDAFIDMHRTVKQTSCPGARVAARIAELRRYVLNTPTIGSTPPAPTPGGPTMEPVVDTICEPSWAPPKGNAYPGTAGDRGMFRLVCNDATSPYEAIVLAYPGVPLAGGLTGPTFRYGDVFGVPALFIAGLNGKPIGLAERANGDVVVRAADGGSFVVARKPA